MADDDGLRAGVAQHFGGNIAGIGARGFSAWQSWPPMATGDPRAAAAKLAISVAGGQTITSTLASFAQAPRAGDDLFQFADRGLKPVHFPVAGDQRTARHRFAQNALQEASATKSR